MLKDIFNRLQQHWLEPVVLAFVTGAAKAIGYTLFIHILM
jgi:hypothetical protein